LKKYVVFNMRVAGYLQLKGFQIKKLEQARNNATKHVFIFNDTDELRKAISQYDNFIDCMNDYSFG